MVSYSIIKRTKLGWCRKLEPYLSAVSKITLPCAHSYACHFSDIEPQEGLHTYLYTWLENQVMAVDKINTSWTSSRSKNFKDCFRVISRLLKDIFLKVEQEESPINTFSPQLAILSSRHESQYSRLFRS
jgi:urease accessory protein